jgi:hypothetical protein
MTKNNLTGPTRYGKYLRGLDFSVLSSVLLSDNRD